MNGVEYFGPQTNGLDGSDYRFWDENFHFDLIFDSPWDQYDWYYDSSHWNDGLNVEIAELNAFFSATSMDSSHDESITIENIYSKNVSEIFDAEENLPLDPVDPYNPFDQIAIKAEFDPETSELAIFKRSD